MIFQSSSSILKCFYLIVIIAIFYSYKSNKSKRNIIENNDKVIWQNEDVKIYANHVIIEEGEERLVIYSNKKDTLLNFLHEDGGKITFPFVINTNEEVFINFFEIWEGSGFLSKKNFYHLNQEEYTLNKVENVPVKNILQAVKTKFKIADSIYTRKGEFYKNFTFDKTCFNENNELPFSLVIYNHDNPNLNKGLEGFKTVKGVYTIEKEDNYMLTFSLKDFSE
ncbi:hypothetical protein [Aquimarina litoralis]|uniref:hypothetical protein n=1 Tax=Aquimarina litoralis TaxID=584605 RepID=UPI001C5888DF|nr:hypothetical protein [Aquimarina litoralis]MBW1297004.1 hypothetical protein [Aquimarina litoralis]